MKDGQCAGPAIVSPYRWGVASWSAATGECLQVIAGRRDVTAIAAGALLFPWRALARGFQTVIEDAASGQVIARFPIVLADIVTHPTSRQWAGSVDIHVVMIALEGGAAPTT